MKVYVNFNDNRWKKYAIDFDKIANAVVSEKYKNAEVSITLTNDTEIHKLNKKYRNIDRPTNVLSFELGDDLLLGDIYISLDTVKREADAENMGVPEHTAHMVVHGVLHLLGYDHIKESDAVIMEKKEITVMKKLGYANPYADENNVSCDCPGDKTILFFSLSNDKITAIESTNGFWRKIKSIFPRIDGSPVALSPASKACITIRLSP